MKKERLLDFVTQKVERCKILVVGDVMLDRYYYGEVNRISPEAPVPVNHVTGQKDTLGGAANVAHNLALLGAQTAIAGFVGDDYHCQTLTEKFTARGIDFRGRVQNNRPTTTKMRIIGGHQQMLRLDFEDTRTMEDIYVDRLLNYIARKLDESIDAVILSDYAKSTCNDRICREVIKEAHAHGVPVVIDPKGTNWTKYMDADYITPNLKEINEVLLEPIKNEDEAVVRAAQYVRRKYKIKNVLVTRSEAGMSLVGDQLEEHIPTKAQEVFDVSGAGDTVIAVLATGLAGGLSSKEAAFLANLAASVVVAKLGTYAVSHDELLDALEKLNRSNKEEVE